MKYSILFICGAFWALTWAQLKNLETTAIENSIYKSKDLQKKLRVISTNGVHYINSDDQDSPPSPKAHKVLLQSLVQLIDKSLLKKNHRVVMETFKDTSFKWHKIRIRLNIKKSKLELINKFFPDDLENPYFIEYRDDLKDLISHPLFESLIKAKIKILEKKDKADKKEKRSKVNDSMLKKTKSTSSKKSTHQIHETAK